MHSRGTFSEMFYLLIHRQSKYSYSSCSNFLTPMPSSETLRIKPLLFFCCYMWFFWFHFSLYIPTKTSSYARLLSSFKLWCVEEINSWSVADKSWCLHVHFKIRPRILSCAVRFVYFLLHFLCIFFICKISWPLIQVVIVFNLAKYLFIVLM